MPSLFDPSVRQEMNADFDAALAAAEAADASPSTPVAETAPETPSSGEPDPAPSDAVTPEAASTSEASSAPASASASPTALADDAIVEVTVNGQPVHMPWGEAKRSLMMHAAFTQKTQAIAEQRKALEAERAAAAKAVEDANQLKATLLRASQDPNFLSALYLAAQGKQQDTASPVAAPQAAPAPIDPQVLKEYLFQSIAPEVQQYVTQQTALERQTAELDRDITTYTNALIDDDPILKELGDDFKDTIYGRVAKMEPQSQAQAKEFIGLQIKDYKDRLAKARGESAKLAAVAKAKAVTGTERGGTPVTPTPKVYEKFDDMQDDMLAMVLNHPGR